jgi:hypothetical protein
MVFAGNRALAAMKYLPFVALLFALAGVTVVFAWL